MPERIRSLSRAHQRRVSRLPEGHIKPLACGGPDAVWNLQWQTIRDATAKDRWERRVCGRWPDRRSLWKALERCDEAGSSLAQAGVCCADCRCEPPTVRSCTWSWRVAITDRPAERLGEDARVVVQVGRFRAGQIVDVTDVRRWVVEDRRDGARRRPMRRATNLRRRLPVLGTNPYDRYGSRSAE